MELSSEVSVSSIQLLCASKRYRGIKQNAFSLHQSGKALPNTSVNVVTPAFTVTSVLQSRFLLQLPGMNKIHTFSTQKSFRLAAWKISDEDYNVKDFHRRSPTFSSPHGEKALQGNMRVLGDRGVAGVTLDRLIVFQHLSKTS